MDKLIFIVGVGRSGTSLLQSMLSSQSHINITPESHFIKNYMSSDKKIKRLRNRGINNLERLFLNDKNILKSNIDINLILSKYKQKNNFELNKVFENFQKLHLNVMNKKIGGEKDARNIDYLFIIKKYFPNSKVILIYRDPRDVVLSKSKANWSSHRPNWLHSLIGNSQLCKGLIDGPRLFKKNFTKIKYEDLLENPKKELEKICDFINIKFEDRMLEFQQTAKKLFVKKDEMQFKYNNFKPLIKNNNNKWVNNLTSNEIWFIQSTNFKLFKKLNYDIHRNDSFNLFHFIFTPFLIMISILFNLLYVFVLKFISFR